MALEKLVFDVGDLEIELTPKLLFPVSNESTFRQRPQMLGLVPVNVIASVIFSRNGYLQYDASKNRFITAVTDFYSQAKCDPSAIEEMNRVYSTLLHQGLVPVEEVTATTAMDVVRRHNTFQAYVLACKERELEKLKTAHLG